jgi:hypothetical protein
MLREKRKDYPKNKNEEESVCSVNNNISTITRPISMSFNLF